MKIRLNVATEPLESHRRFLAGAAGAGALGLVFLALLSASVWSTWRQESGQRAAIARYESQLNRIETQQEALAAFFAAPQTKQVVDRADFLNSLIDQRSFPWTNIFTDLEKVLPPGVYVVSIAPKMADGQVDVKLVVAALTDASKLAFLQQLQKSPAFSDVRLDSETTHTSEGGQGEMSVQLEAVYSGAADPPTSAGAVPKVRDGAAGPHPGAGVRP